MYLCFRCDYWFRGELHVRGLKDGVLLQDVLLGLVVAKRLVRKHENVTKSGGDICFAPLLLPGVYPTLRPYKHW